MKIKISFLASLLLLFVSCKEEVQKEKSIQKVKCEEVVALSSTLSQSTFSGRVVAAKDVNLSFRVAGVVEKVNVKVGDFVKEGQVVASLDKRDYLLQLAATQAEYDGVKAEVDRVVELYSAQSVSANDYDKAVNGLKRITAKLESHRNALLDTDLKAPFDGYVQTTLFDKGEALSAGMPIVALVSASAPEVVINIPSSQYLERKNLISATSVVNILPENRFNLTYLGAAPKANLNQLYQTRFLVSADKGLFPSVGMSVLVTLNYKNENDAGLEVALNSIFEEDDKTYVWVVESGKVEARSISVVKIKTNGKAVVVGELKAGESVVSAGVNSLVQGQAVEPIVNSESNIGNIL